VKECKEAKEKYDIKMVSFVDDIFCISKGWLREFADKYVREVNLPYSINTRANTIDDEVAELLKKSNCFYVTYSIETGDNHLRNDILNRGMSDEMIIKAANSLRKYNLHFCNGNLLGIPEETMDTLIKTVKINQKCKSHYAWASIFQPFPRVNLTEYSIEHGYFDGNYDNIGDDQFTNSPLKLNRKDEIVRFHKFFALVVKYPYLMPLVRVLIKLPLNEQCHWIFKKYKIRLNNSVVDGDKELMEKQYNEGIFDVVAFLLKDLHSGVMQKPESK
jgi:radical SAM superfamily enzyme YgiQ (UPF0313 family)